MSYNGSGTFTINTTGQPVVAGTVITASAFNSLTTDLATGLTTAITKDGQTTTTARIIFAQGTRDSTLTASSAVASDASKNLVSVTNTGTGNNVLATSPTLVTPALGTPASGVMTNVTGLPLSTGVTGTLPVANGGTGLTTVPHTVQVFTSSSGTYTTPANCKAIFVRLVGAGGGGSGGSGGGAGGTGGNTTFSTLSGSGGGGGSSCNQGGGGAASGGDLNATGADGSFGIIATGVYTGGAGAASPLGGNGGSGSASGAGYAGGGYGAGGGGAGATASSFAGGGAGSGGYVDKTSNLPSATCSDAVGAGGAGGTAASGGGAGGAGSGGVIIVTEYYV